MKLSFSFTYKALFVLKIFNFLSWTFGHTAKWLDKKDKVNFKFYGVTAWLKKTIVMHILLNISRSKGNQAMKFGQLIEHNIRNIFLEKSCTKCVREIISRLFYKKSKFSISLDFLILLFAKLRTIESDWN